MVSLRNILIEAAVVALRDAGKEERSPAGSQASLHRERAPNSSYSAFAGIVAWFKQTVFFSFVVCLLFFSSLLLYAVIYFLVMPPNFATAPLFFDYKYDCNHHPARRSFPPGLNDTDNILINHIPEKNWREERIESSGENGRGNHTYDCAQNVEKTVCRSPIAIVDLFTRHTQWKAYDLNVAPPPMTSSISRRILRQGDLYFIDVALTMPESDVNKQIGMFMLELSLKDTDGCLLASSKRAAMLPYESSMISTIRKLIMVGPLLIGAVGETRTVLVKSFDHYMESGDRPLASVEVQLLLPPHLSYQYLDSSQTIQISWAELRIGKELNKVQRLMKEWFFTCAFSITIVLMTVQALFLFWVQGYLDRIKNRVGHEWDKTNQRYEHYSNRDTSGELHSENWSIMGDAFSILNSVQSREMSGNNSIQSTPVDNMEEKAKEHTADTVNIPVNIDIPSTLLDKDGKNDQDSPELTEDDDKHMFSKAATLSTSKLSRTEKLPSQVHRDYESGRKWKRINISKDKREIREPHEEDERLRRVMTGDLEPFHIFTDLDEPD